jgi:hypothetical protein
LGFKNGRECLERRLCKFQALPGTTDEDVFLLFCPLITYSSLFLWRRVLLLGREAVCKEKEAVLCCSLSLALAAE